MRLLCVTAHPDDEAGNFGGTLLLYRQRGVETYVICLTPGQAATHRGGASSDEALAKIRRAEFAASCRILQVTHGEVLDYPDGRLDRTNLYEVVGDLVARVRRIRPHVMLTFGPEGSLTAHTDHGMASIFATMAFHWAGREDRFPEQLDSNHRQHKTQKLYYATADFLLPGRPPISPPPATTVIEIGKLVEVKIAAFKQHTSQAPLFQLFENHVSKRGTREFFHLAARATPSTLTAETDLFEGVAE
jgi:LmbE family N-acetylglucosaminyl deacetylase